MNDKLIIILAEVFNLKSEEVQIELLKEDVSSWDSLKQMDLVTSLESEYSISFEITDIIQMNSVRGIIDVLISKGVNFDN
jgi:acyl carrier protein